MAVSIDEILTRLESSGILTPGELASVRAEAAAVSLDGDGEAFIKRLHKTGRITAYQAQALWKDKANKLAFGNYVIEDELGRGGMGVVLKARHKRMQRHVAIKVLPAAMIKDAGAIARFQREVIAAAQLTHSNIVSAHDADEVNGQHILVMEYVPGRDLSSVVKQQGPLTVAQAVDCVIQAARGLEFAHKRGVIHRDIKPANLLLDNEGTVKILDMGLARFSDSADVGTQAELTGTGMIMGTVDYMSPEQALSTKAADARSDIYSLGITLYYLLTGQPAYTGESLMARMMAHASQPIPDLATTRPEVPAAVQAVFARMVAKQPEDRYQTMTAALADLESCLQGSPSANLQSVLPATATEGLSSELGTFANRGNSATGGAQSAVTVARAQLTQAAQGEQTLVSQPTSETLLNLAGSRHLAQKAPAKSLFHNPRVQLGLGGGLIALLLAAMVFFFQSPHGTLRVEINDPEIEVSIKGTEIVLKGANQQDITLTPGEHAFHVKRGNFEFDTASLILKKRETVTVKVELLDGEVQVASGGTVLGSKALSAASVASTAKTDLRADSNTGWHGWPADAPKPAIAPFDAAQAKQHQEEWAAYLKVPVEYTNSIGMKFRLIPPGEFLMRDIKQQRLACVE